MGIFQSKAALEEKARRSIFTLETHNAWIRAHAEVAVKELEYLERSVINKKKAHKNANIDLMLGDIVNKKTEVESFKESIQVLSAIIFKMKKSINDQELMAKFSYAVTDVVKNTKVFYNPDMKMSFFQVQRSLSDLKCMLALNSKSSAAFDVQTNVIAGSTEKTYAEKLQEERERINAIIEHREIHQPQDESKQVTTEKEDELLQSRYEALMIKPKTEMTQ